MSLSNVIEPAKTNGSSTTSEDDWAKTRMIDAAKQKSDEIRRRMAKKGSLGLPSLLDKRRLEYGIVDKYFDIQCVYDKFMLFQLEADPFKKTIGDTSLIFTEVGLKRAKEEEPRGVIISAGLRAMDVLRSNGMDLGHIVRIVKLAPYRIPVDYILGMQMYAIMLSVGQIVASEDLAGRLRAGKMKVHFDGEQHILASGKTKVGKPVSPWRGDDY